MAKKKDNTLYWITAIAATIYIFKDKFSVNGINGNEIIEYKVSRGAGGKFYVSSNVDFGGSGIKKIGDGNDHKRGLMTFLITPLALKKIEKRFGKNSLKYIESDY